MDFVVWLDKPGSAAFFGGLTGLLGVFISGTFALLGVVLGDRLRRNAKNVADLEVRRLVLVKELLRMRQIEELYLALIQREVGTSPGAVRQQVYAEADQQGIGKPAESSEPARLAREITRLDE